MVFIGLEKCYNKILKVVTWWTFIKRVVPHKYIDIINDIYNGLVQTLELVMT